MALDFTPDLSCVPYRRKGLYLALTVPLLGIFVMIFGYLWGFSFALSFVFLTLYLGVCTFQAYCCYYQDCPYVGGFCPAVIGIMPASLIARVLFSGRPVVKSKRRFDLYATLAVMCWIGVIAFPLFWIAKVNVWFAVGYVLVHMVYTLIFGLTICPACAIRDICPGGQFQKFVARQKGRRSV